MNDVGGDYAEVVGELGQRWPDAKVMPVLDRERMLLDLMGSPQNNYPIVHVGGTNGKSSTVFMADELLRAFGLRVGRFTSPDLQLLDRISVHGAHIDHASFVSAYREVAPYVAIVDARSRIQLTRFEVLTAMAYSAFADAPVDAAVVEVGMGGSWDSTNAADGLVAVLTPIALDHQDYLGDTLTDIATEKAGIIKPGATVVCARQSGEALSPIVERCTDVRATLLREAIDFGVERRAIAVGGQVLTLHGIGGAYPDVFLPLHGAHQAQNAALALVAVEAFFGADSRQLDVDIIRQGFAAVSSPGRLERIRAAPTIVLDTAHNPHGMHATVAALADDFDFRRIIGVISVFLDKDAHGMLEALEPGIDAIVVTKNTSLRAMPSRQLAAIAVEIFGEDRVHVTGGLPDAIETAVALAESDMDGELGGVGILITGSMATVAEARRLLTR